MATRIITSITFILLSFFISTTSTFAQCDPDTLPPTLLCNDWTVVSLSSNPDTFDLHYIIYELSDNCNDTLALTFAINGVPVDQQWPFGCPDVGEHIVEVSATDSLGNQSTCLSDLRIEDKIPAWINCQPDTMPITVYLSADDPDTLVLDEFVAEVFDFCPETPVNYHFVTHLADGNSISSPTSPTFNCSMLNAVTVEAIAYDYYSGDYHTCSRTVQVLDTLGLCDTIMLTGTLFQDSIGNCLFDTAEEGLAGQEVFIQYFPYAYTQTLLTDSLGRFSSTFFGPAGQEGLFRVAPLGFPDYALSCGTTLEFPFDAGTDTVTGNIPLQLVDDCPLLTVDIGAPFLRKCQENTLTVSYCNQSLMLIENAYVEVTLEEVMAFVGSSIPLDAAANNVYTFQLGDIAPLACGSFNLNVTDLCNTTIGQTLCVEAHIYPDEICAPGADENWTGASIVIEQNCDNDEVSFTIKNVGSAPTAAPLDYTIVEDLVMYMEGSFDLEVGEEHLITLPGNGSTWRAEAEQEPGHPGVFQPAAWVEGCGGLNSTGLVNAFPTNNNDPFLSVFCDEVIAAFDPNDKVGFPQGRGANKLIRPNQDIEYRIRFQNTGTDTAFKVVIVDTLSSVFQRASFRPGASSHPYELDIDESGIVHFIFNDILLPDSTTNPGGSIGFVKFRIAQLPDLEPGTNLNNEAAIYFDAEAPVITNLAWHTIEDTPQVTTSTAPLVTSKMVSVFPNPALDHVVFLIEGEGLGLSLLTLFDGQGRLVKGHSFTGKRFVLKRGGLASGVYFYRLTLPDGHVSTGKLLLKD